MLTLQKNGKTETASISTGDIDADQLLSKEWLLTNSRGSYASSTIIGCNTRRYHGLLVGSLDPPVNRIMALANCHEIVVVDGELFYLSTFEFNEQFSPEGFGHIKKFRCDTGVHFDYQAEPFELTKSIYLLDDTDTVALVYDFSKIDGEAEFILRPFVGLRDFHSLQRSYANICSNQTEGGLLIRHDIPQSCELFLKCDKSSFEKDSQWWFNFTYREDRFRGQDFTEDLWSPGFYKCRIDSAQKIVFWANLSDCSTPHPRINTNIGSVCKNLRKKRSRILAYNKPKDQKLEKLFLAADQFITKRQGKQDCGTTILAGYPWFADWGRDSFISLPGLLLSTHRFEEAKSVLTTFAAAADKGMIPNRFDDYTNTTHFNSVDASLWFINASFEYLEKTKDNETFTDSLLPVIITIINAYQKGARFGIHADSDGLITAGTEETQLTWMDAKSGDTAFTPRYGKTVEINALWYNSLCHLGRFYADKDVETAQHYHRMADKVEKRFRKSFWNEKLGYLNDCILPDGTIDSALRPNQIFAVSLPFSPLPSESQRSVVEAVQKELLTPFGLRTLNTKNENYKGTYHGPQNQRDAAYHQGTVWAYLLGPFVEAYLKVNDFSEQSKTQAAQFIEPLLGHLTEDACIGQISEIFDGDLPHKPKGCIGQAWSVAELIRAYRLIKGTSS